MRIVLFDHTLETTAFISRSIKKFINFEYKVFTLCFNKKILNIVDRVIHVGSGIYLITFTFLQLRLFWAIESRSLSKSIKHFFKSDIKQINQLNCDVALNFYST